jgi:arsenical pump membrane protein
MGPIARLAIGAAVAAAALAIVLDSHAARDSASQSWRAFVLVTGLLLVGVVAADDGLFAWLAAKLDAVPGGGRSLFFAGLALVAATTAFPNLDTAVVFLTPVMIAAARRRGLDEQPFLYGTIFMVNASSLFLPGSNLTNLIVIGHEHVTGSEFARRMLPAALAATVATAIAVWLLHHRQLGGGQRETTRAARPGAVGVLATAGVVVLLLTGTDPALAVLALGVIAAAVMAIRRRLNRHDLLDAVNPLVLAAVFCVAVALGTLARAWSGPAQLMSDLGSVATAGVGAIAAALLNNLPAAALLSAQHVDHPRALLIGLNIGPNLAVTGSLSAFLWLQAARTARAQASIARYSRLGIVVAAAGIGAALFALWAVAPSRV